MKRNNKAPSDIKSQLLKAGIENVPVDFTSSLMKEIMAEADDESVINPALKGILRRHGLHEPSSRFEHAVMARVKAQTSNYKAAPVISLRVWIQVAVTTVVLTVALLMSNPSVTPASPLTSQAQQIGRTLSGLLFHIPSLYLLTFFGLVVLLVGDYILTRRRPA